MVWRSEILVIKQIKNAFNARRFFGQNSDFFTASYNPILFNMQMRNVHLLVKSF